MTALRPYPDYRDSGLDWLPQVPAHWEVVRNGRLFAERNETGFPDLPILEVSLRTGVRVRDMDGGRKQQMADRAKYKRAAAGDIAYNIMRMWQGAVGIAPCDGLISPAYVVARPLGAIDPRFYAYLFRTTAYMREVDFASRGIVPDRNRLYWQYFKPLLSPAPPPEEQRRIADFLDAYTAQVHRLITAKRRVVAMLETMRAAAYRECIERDRTARPIRLKYIAEFASGGTPPTRVQEYWEREVPWVSPKDMRTDSVSNAQDWISRSALDADYSAFVPTDSLIMAVRSGILRRKLPVARTTCDVAINQDMKALTLDRSRVRPQFLLNYFHAYEELILDKTRRVGTTVESIEHELLRDLRIDLPSNENQEALEGEMDRSARLITRALFAEQQAIDLILEYRDSLIAALVTGGLDVRDAPVPVITGDDLADDTASADEDMEDALDAVD